MKKLVILSTILSLSTAALAQITISTTDMPIPTAPYHITDFSTSSAPVPTPSIGGVWNYASYTGAATTVNYATETDTYFTAAGADVNNTGFKSLAPGFGYNLYSEIDFSSTAIKEVGINIPKQVFDLSVVTGDAGDSMVIPAQKEILVTPKPIIQFPCTAGSNWTSTSRRVTNYTITVASASLVNTPGQHAYNIVRKDSIAGYGKMTVRSTSGPSIQYDVLLDKMSQYAADSFYLFGMPAPTTLLDNFGVTQGQITDTTYRYIFYRKSTFSYLVMFNFGSDPTYTDVTGQYYNTDNIIPANVGVEGPTAKAITTILYPNPCKGTELNLLMQGANATAATYVITDMIGRTIQAGPTVIKQGAIHIGLAAQPNNGNYLLSIKDTNGETMVTEQFAVAQ